MADVKFYGLGRRKSSTARVYLKKGTGVITINKRSGIEYLKAATLVQELEQPLVLTETKGTWDVMVNVKGGGLTGQAGAIRLGVARALLEASQDYRFILKKSGMLTRDARKKERKKPGLRKARRARQFSKR
ncbi:MAG: 30S ribosomal protein S9 [Mycoplasma sp.]|nr:30S ribosomal protein S9 [Mycoplasma sp.]